MSAVRQENGAKRAVVVVKKAPEPPPMETKPGFWSQFEGQRLVFTMRGKQIIVGTFAGKHYGMLKLENVTVKGQVYTANVPWIQVEPASVNFFHPEGDVQRHFTKEKKKNEAVD